MADAPQHPPRPIDRARLEMARDDLDDVPQFTLPYGFTLRTFRPGDEHAWVAIHQDADKLQDVTLETFEKNFAYDLPAMADRCFFIVAPDGRDVGTGTAWYDDAPHAPAPGRVHWICIMEEFQGRGLGNALLSAVMTRLARSHDRCYLTTSTGRLPAIGLYLKFGLVPLVKTDADRAAWQYVAERLSHPALDAFR